MKLKKIASLALAGVMAVSMLTACNTTSGQPQNPTTPPTTTPAAGKSAVFEAALTDLADVKITMSDSNDLQTALDAAAQNVGSATIIDFTTALRAAGTAISGVRTIANFDDSGDVYIANVNAGTTGSWGALTNARAGDLSVVAADMDAQNVMNAFIDLVPGHKEVADETVTMLFAVDGAIGEDAAVRQVATVLDDEIGALQIDDDWNTDIGSVGDHTTLHYTYTGSVSITNRALADNHGMSLNIIAVQITRTANA